MKNINETFIYIFFGALACVGVGTILNAIGDSESGQWAIGTGYVLGVISVIGSLINILFKK